MLLGSFVSGFFRPFDHCPAFACILYRSIGGHVCIMLFLSPGPCLFPSKAAGRVPVDSCRIKFQPMALTRFQFLFCSAWISFHQFDRYRAPTFIEFTGCRRRSLVRICSRPVVMIKSCCQVRPGAAYIAIRRPCSRELVDLSFSVVVGALNSEHYAFIIVQEKGLSTLPKLYL